MRNVTPVRHECAKTPEPWLAQFELRIVNAGDDHRGDRTVRQRRGACIGTRPAAGRNAMRPLREISLAEIETENCREFLDYWESKKKGSDPPLRRDFDPLIEKPHLVHNVFIEQSCEE